MSASLPHTDPVWVGRWSATAAYALSLLRRKDAASARRVLSEEMRAFLASPLATPELKERLRRAGR